MGFINNLFNKYKEIERLGLSHKEAKELDMLDGEKDLKYKGKSLFDVVSEYKDTYEESQTGNPNRVSFFEYIKQQLAVAAENEELLRIWLKPVVVSGNTDKITNDLLNAFSNNPENAGNFIKMINKDNVEDIIKNYKKKNDEKKRFLGIKYDNESLAESILEANIPDKTKKEYLMHIKNALVEKITSLTGDASYTSQLFDLAIDKAISRKNSKILDKLISKLLEIIPQLEKMDAKNKTTPYFGYSSNQTKDLLKNILDEIGTTFNITMEDVYGNGYFDNNAKQMTGNCWAHACINNMLTTKAGKQYINNLIVRTEDKITVYLPGAKKDGLPKPKGDGLFTYTPAQITDNIMIESAGDGDYTAFMMAVTDYRKMISDDSQATSDGGNMRLFNHLVFGTDSYDFDALELINSPKLPSKSKKAFKNFKKLFNAGKGYFSIFTEKTANTSCHEYSVVRVNDDSVVLKESNNPNNTIVIDAKTFIETFVILYYEYPKDIM